MAAGWTSRAERMLDVLGPDPAEAGYVSFLQMYRALGEGDWGAAAARARTTAEIGRRHGVRDLIALGLVSMGRIAIYAGLAADGLARLDEAMVAVAAGEVSPEVFGNVYCTAIEGCQEVAAFDRVAEWTSALHALVHGAPRTGHVHGPVLDPPWAGDAAPRRLAGRPGGVRPGGRTVPPRRHPGPDRPGRGRARRRAPPAG